MLKFIKRLFLFLLFGILLIVVSGVAFLYIFDANDYKEQIVSYIEAQSKRSVSVEALDLSLFPLLGIRATRVQVGENPDFGTVSFLSIAEMRLGVMLLPLLRGAVRVDGIHLTGVRVHVVRNEQGVFNFDDLRDLATAEQSTPDNGGTTGNGGTTSRASQALALSGFGGVSLEDGYLLWDDRLSDTRVICDEVNFTSEPWSPYEPTAVSIAATMSGLSGALRDATVALALNAELTPDLSTGEVQFDDIRITAQLTQPHTLSNIKADAQIDQLYFGDDASRQLATAVRLKTVVGGLGAQLAGLEMRAEAEAHMQPDWLAKELTLSDTNAYIVLQGHGEQPLNAQLKVHADTLTIGDKRSAETPINLTLKVDNLMQPWPVYRARAKLKAQLAAHFINADASLKDIATQVEIEAYDAPLTTRLNASLDAIELRGGTLLDGQAISVILDARADGLSQSTDTLSAELRATARVVPNLSTDLLVHVADLSASTRVRGLDEDVVVKLLAANNRALLEGQLIADRFSVVYGDLRMEGHGELNDLYQSPKANLQIPSLEYGTWQFRDITLLAAQVDERLLLDLRQAKFHQGIMTADAELNLRSDAYKIKLLATALPIDKVQAALDAEQRPTVRGQARLKLALTGSAGDMDQILETSEGTIDMHIRQGALYNRSLAEVVERAVAFLEGRAHRTVGEELIFDDLRARWILHRGIAKNDDLAVRMPLLGVTGAGQVDLIAESADYTLSAYMKDEQQIQIPVRIYGSLESPQYQPDFSLLIQHELLKKSKLKEKAKAKVDKIERKIQDRIQDKVKAGLPEQLKDKLKLPF